MNSNHANNIIQREGSAEKNKRNNLFKEKQFFPISSNHINIDSLLEKKLFVKTATKPKGNKFLI